MNESAILKQWLSGNGLPDTLVIDGHIHVGEWPHGTTFNSVDEAADLSARIMNTNGVDAACIQSGGYMWPPADYHLGNDFLLALCRRLPDRLIGFMNVNPNDRHDRVIAELNRMYDNGIRCIKLLNQYQENYPGDGPRLMAVYEFAARKKMIVFDHWWTNDVITRICAQFPTVTFIFAHYSAGQDEILRQCPNVYANIWTLASTGFLDRGVRNVGAGKFMLGSDGFLNPLSVGIGPVVFGDFSDEQKRQVLGLNLARLLDEVGVLPAPAKKKYLAARKV